MLKKGEKGFGGVDCELLGLLSESSIEVYLAKGLIYSNIGTLDLLLTVFLINLFSLTFIILPI